MRRSTRMSGRGGRVALVASRRRPSEGRVLAMDIKTKHLAPWTRLATAFSLPCAGEGVMKSQGLNSVRPGRRISELLAIGAGMVAVLATACGTATPRPGASSTRGVTTPTPSQSATPMPATTSFRSLIVRETGVDSWVVDLYDWATQKTSTIPTVDLAPNPARFAPGGRISYMTSAGHLVSQNLDGSGRRVEVAAPILQYGWGPDGSLAYTAETGANGELSIRPAHGASTTVDLGVGTGYP
jgi:hypothetical protein